MARQTSAAQRFALNATSLYFAFCLFLIGNGDVAQAASLIPGLPAIIRDSLERRQITSTAGNNTNPYGSANGGAQSAADAASAAGHSIDTGTGGDRSTPTTREDFARLLSGTFFGW